MSENAPERDPRNDDPRTQVEDWLAGSGGMIGGAILILIVLGFIYYFIVTVF